MKFVIQRVKHASVTVEGNVLGKIEQGLMVLIGVCESDNEQVADKMGHKDTRMVDRIYARTRHESVMVNAEVLDKLNESMIL